MSTRPPRMLDHLTTRQRLMLLGVGVAVILIAAIALFTVPGREAPAPRTTSAAAPPGWQPTASAFARAYERYLTGRAAPRDLPATAKARMIAARGGAIPARAHNTRSHLSTITPTAASGSTVRALFTVQSAGNAYPAEITLTARNGTWRVVDLVPPDFATITAPPAPPPPAVVAELQRAADTFARRYLRYVSGARSTWPAPSPTIRRQIRSGVDPLAESTADLSDTELALRYGPPQGDRVTVTATIGAATKTAFSFVMRKTRGRWQPYAFVIDSP